VAGCLNNNKPFHFGTDQDDDQAPGISGGIFVTTGLGQLRILWDQLPFGGLWSQSAFS